MHKKLLQLLEQERAAIVKADFEKVDSFAEQKTTLFEQSLARTTDPQILSDIRAALLRNQTLLQAAIDGVSAARTRIAALREVRDNLRVYDQSGRIAQVAATTPDLSKRS